LALVGGVVLAVGIARVPSLHADAGTTSVGETDTVQGKVHSPRWNCGNNQDSGTWCANGNFHPWSQTTDSYDSTCCSDQLTCTEIIHPDTGVIHRSVCGMHSAATVPENPPPANPLEGEGLNGTNQQKFIHNQGFWSSG
jgi:hypothetical protein